MRLEKKLKLIMIIVLLFALLVYHFLGIKTPDTIAEIFKDFDTVIFTIVRIIATVLILLFTISNSFIAKIFNWGSYIGGKYKGNVIDPTNTSTSNGQINLTIKQSLLNIKITGVTFRPNGQKLITEYVIQGNLANMDTDVFKFIVELEGQASRNYGLMSLRFEDNVGHGYLYENNPAQTREVQISRIKSKFIEKIKSIICK